MTYEELLWHSSMSTDTGITHYLLSADKVTSRQQVYPSLVCPQSAKEVKCNKLDQGSISSSQRNRLKYTFHILQKKIRLMMFSLNMMDYPMSFFLLSSWIFFWLTSTGDHSKTFLLFEYCCGIPPSCSKVMGGGGGGWWVVAWSNLVSAQGPFFWVWDLGFGARA